MFRTIRKACFWLFAIVMVLAIAAGGAAWYYWSNADRILHETVTARLTEWSPHLRFQLGRCRLDWLGRIHVEQFSLTLPESERPLVDLPDTIVDLDRDALINRQELSVLSLRFLQPQIEATRYPDGTWDFQKLPPFPKSDRRSSLPDCELENAQLIIHVVREHGAEPATMIADNANLKLTPEGKRNLHIEGQARLEHVGQRGLLHPELVFLSRIDVGEDAEAGREFPAHQPHARGHADGRDGVGAGEARTLGGEAVEMRRQNMRQPLGLALGLSVRPDRAPAHVIDVEIENVRSLFRGAKTQGKREYGSERRTMDSDSFHDRRSVGVGLTGRKSKETAEKRSRDDCATRHC